MTVRRVLVVDAANVVGSRPDGWWRDRVGAVRRLLDALRAGLAGAGTDVVVVLEGAGRAGAPEGEAGGVRVVHAVASGDDAVVAVVAGAGAAADPPAVTVVTADRALRDRVTALGAATTGPRTLWDLLEPAHPADGTGRHRL